MAALAEHFRLPVFEQFASGEVVMEDPYGVVRRGTGYASMAGACRIAGGLGRVIDALVEEIPVNRRRTGTKVVRLTAAESIPTWMAGQAKIVAVHDRPYWREQGLSGDATSRHGPMVEIHDASPAEHGPYALFGFVGIPPDVRLTRRDAVLEAARVQLVRVFGDALAHPLALELMDWAHEPLTATPADHHSLGHHPAYGLPRAMMNVWEGRVLFGSTETGQQFGGYLEGALEAADSVFNELGRTAAFPGRADPASATALTQGPQRSGKLGLEAVRQGMRT
jgi:monoamine oxidase